MIIVLTARNQGDAGTSTQAASSSIASSKTQEKNLAKLEQIISKAVGSIMRVKCEVAASEKGEVKSEKVTPMGDDTIDDAMAIFTSWKCQVYKVIKYKEKYVW